MSQAKKDCRNAKRSWEDAKEDGESKTVVDRAHTNYQQKQREMEEAERAAEQCEQELRGLSVDYPELLVHLSEQSASRVMPSRTSSGPSIRAQCIEIVLCMACRVTTPHAAS